MIHIHKKKQEYSRLATYQNSFQTVFHICCVVCAANIPLTTKAKKRHSICQWSSQNTQNISSKWLFQVKMPRVRILCTAFYAVNYWVCSNCVQLSTSHILSNSINKHKSMKAELKPWKAYAFSLFYIFTANCTHLTTVILMHQLCSFSLKGWILIHSKQKIHDTYYLLP